MSERKAWIAVAVVALASLLVIGALWMVYSERPPANPSDYIFYYSLTCPHCQAVEEFITANNIASKVTIVRKEVSQDEANLNELLSVSRSCGIPQNETGVPLGYYQNKCYLGQEDNTAILAKLAGVAAP
jgi:hypothetical protein